MNFRFILNLHNECARGAECTPEFIQLYSHIDIFKRVTVKIN